MQLVKLKKSVRINLQFIFENYDFVSAKQIFIKTISLINSATNWKTVCIQNYSVNTEVGNLLVKQAKIKHKAVIIICCDMLN